MRITLARERCALHHALIAYHTAVVLACNFDSRVYTRTPD